MSPARIDASELPKPTLRRLLLAGPLPTTAGREGPAADRHRAPAPRRGRWRCHACKEVAPSWAAAERHADAAHHLRIEVILW